MDILLFSGNSFACNASVTGEAFPGRQPARVNEGCAAKSNPDRSPRSSRG